jgi:hypothetical protein
MCIVYHHVVLGKERLGSGCCGPQACTTNVSWSLLHGKKRGYEDLALFADYGALELEVFFFPTIWCLVAADPRHSPWGSVGIVVGRLAPAFVLYVADNAG